MNSLKKDTLIAAWHKILASMFNNQNDPVKHCELYKEQGCSHVDGFLCDFPSCSMRADYNNSKLQEKQ